MFKQRPKLSQDDVYSPSRGSDDIRLEIRGTESVRQRHDISSDIMRELPSRAVETLLEPCQNGTLRGKKDKTAYKTLRLRNLNPCVYNELDESRLLNILENDPDAENMQVEEVEKYQTETLREIHLSLTAKRKLKGKLEKKNQKRMQKKLGCCKQLKYSLSMKWHHFKQSFKDSIHNLQLWKKAVRTIEGNFGSGVASYFRFLRWLLGLNIFFFILIFMLVILPALLDKLPEAQHFEHSDCRNDTNITTANFTANFTVSRRNVSFSGKELLTGAGSFEHTILYYGEYASTKFSLFKNTMYDTPLAYLLTNALGLFLVLIISAAVLVSSHIKNYIEYHGFGDHFYSNKVFAGWDFAITSEKAAALQSRRLYLDLKERLVGVSNRKAARNINEKCKSLGINISFNLFSFAVLGVVAYLLFLLLEKNYLKTDIKLIREMSTALTVSAITIVMPLIFTFISHFEKYKSHQLQLKITMFRALLLIVVILGILIYFWLNPERHKPGECWETRLGMEIYRLMIVDFVVWNVLYVLMCWVKKIVHYNEGQCIGNLEFEVSWHTWHLLYNQVLCWVGTYFVPFLPLILIIKLILTFYIKKECVLRCCLPPTRVWKANVAETIFLITTFVGLISSIAVFGYIITRKNSGSCGPFAEFEFSYDTFFCVTRAIQPDSFGEIAVLVIKPGTILFIIIALCSLAYCVRATANAHMKRKNLLQKQVATEGRDKTCLLYMIETAMKKLNEQQKIRQLPSSSQAVGDAHQKNMVEIENQQQRGLKSPVASTSTPKSTSANDPEYNANTPFNSSQESMKPLTNLQRSPVKGSENFAYYDDSPRREYSSFDMDTSSEAPSISHRPPLQNLGKSRQKKY